ncbi:helix-turn-helix domain-containing protein [Burkholderia plantarii]|uniref:helix-turn-helix domain-containing protein n=1 Tax=Burkholderia plantarii TaxID=41899 RepID=UPI00272C4E4B|nr:helix-turn-helix domain-containing protein [Burkholderia plantarii]WLE59887.1 helix-turn-helix domain-containing protein [Burkholderia plantarii]
MPEGRKLRLTDIAYQYGFADVPSMTRDFRKHFGCSPKGVQHAMWGHAVRRCDRSGSGRGMAG